MLQWFFTLCGAVNKLAEATLSVAESVDAAAQSLKAAALDSIEDDATKQRLIENDEFHRHAIKTKGTLKAMAEYRQLKESKEKTKSAAKQPQQQ